MDAPPPDPRDRLDATEPDDPRRLPRITRSRSWRSARSDAERLVDDEQATTSLLERAGDRLRSTSATSRLGELIDDLEAALRMARLRVRGRYAHPAPERLVLLVAAMLYLVNPMDVVPDAIPAAGLLDDAAVVGWMLGRLREEIDRFRGWEASRPQLPAEG